jgi:hypothetical protein
MKGVIVQVGHPISIVLLNNGKIKAIPTPANCHVGMVITVKLNNTLKVIIITLAAVVLIALGIFIGARYFGSTSESTPDEYWHGRYWRGGRHMMDSDEHWRGGRRMMERRQQNSF